MENLPPTFAVSVKQDIVAEYTALQTQLLKYFLSGSSGIRTVRMVSFHPSEPPKVHAGLRPGIQDPP